VKGEVSTGTESTKAGVFAEAEQDNRLYLTSLKVGAFIELSAKGSSGGQVKTTFSLAKRL
jgi:hypothetical protein